MPVLRRGAIGHLLAVPALSHGFGGEGEAINRTPLSTPFATSYAGKTVRYDKFLSLT